MLAVSAQAAQLTIHLDQPAAEASITAPKLKLSQPCTADGRMVVCDKLLPQTSYDAKITLKDGTILQGVNMSWYAPLPSPSADPLEQEDIAEIHSIIDDVPSFYDKSRILILQGTAQNAVALVELIRDRDFYHSNGNVIWRIELWYFEQQHGGWARVRQTSNVLRRERFKDAQTFARETKNIRWMPQLGGIQFSDKDEQREINLSTAASTQPVEAQS